MGGNDDDDDDLFGSAPPVEFLLTDIPEVKRSSFTDDYKLGAVLGHGASCTVYKVRELRACTTSVHHKLAQCTCPRRVRRVLS